MLNGNYKLIDLKNIEIKSGDTGATIDGVYNAIDKATNPVKLINVNKNGTKLDTNFGQGVRKSGSDYYVDLGDGTELKVTSSDKVTYTNKSGGGSAETGVVKLTYTDGVGVIDATGAKDLNSLKITVVEESATVISNYVTGYVPIGANVIIAAATSGVLYEVKYVGNIVAGTITKITS